MTTPGVPHSGADHQQAVRRPKRVKYTIMLAIACASGLALLGWTQTWYGLVLVESAGHPGSLPVTGQVAAPAVSALALSGLALAGALSIAGPVLRVVFGVLETLLGASVILSAVLSELDPVTAGAPVVSQITGITGMDSVHALVDETSTTLWPFVTLVAGVLMFAAGLLVIISVRRWPDSSARYQGVRLRTDRDPGAADDPPQQEPADQYSGAQDSADQESADQVTFAQDSSTVERASVGSVADGDEDPTDPVDAWDELTRGTDPTAEPDKPKRRGTTDHTTG